LNTDVYCSRYPGSKRSPRADADQDRQQISETPPKARAPRKLYSLFVHGAQACGVKSRGASPASRSSRSARGPPARFGAQLVGAPRCGPAWQRQWPAGRRGSRFLFNRVFFTRTGFHCRSKTLRLIARRMSASLQRFQPVASRGRLGRQRSLLSRSRMRRRIVPRERCRLNANFQHIPGSARAPRDARADFSCVARERKQKKKSGPTAASSSVKQK